MEHKETLEVIKWEKEFEDRDNALLVIQPKLGNHNVYKSNNIVCSLVVEFVADLLLKVHRRQKKKIKKKMI